MILYHTNGSSLLVIFVDHICLDLPYLISSCNSYPRVNSYLLPVKFMEISSALLLLCSEFEELEAVPTMAVMDGPLEPSVTTSNVAEVPDDPSFVNFFSVWFLAYYLNLILNF